MLPLYLELPSNTGPVSSGGYVFPCPHLKGESRCICWNVQFWGNWFLHLRFLIKAVYRIKNAFGRKVRVGDNRWEVIKRDIGAVGPFLIVVKISSRYTEYFANTSRKGTLSFSVSPYRWSLTISLEVDFDTSTSCRAYLRVLSTNSAVDALLTFSMIFHSLLRKAGIRPGKSRILSIP